MVKSKGMYFQYFSLNWGTFIDTRCIMNLCLSPSNGFVEVIRET